MLLRPGRRTLPARFVRAPPEGDATSSRPPPLRCRCKLCGEAGRSGIANGRCRAGATRAPAWRGNLAPYLTALFEWVEAEPDITTPELAAKSKAEKDMTAHPASLSRLLKAGQSFKKTLLASEAEREDVRQARDEWKVAPPAGHAPRGPPAGPPRRNRH